MFKNMYVKEVWRELRKKAQHDRLVWIVCFKAHSIKQVYFDVSTQKHRA